MVDYMSRKDKEYANHFHTLKKACLEWGKSKMRMSEKHVESCERAR
jgi:hypothetical protein